MITLFSQGDFCALGRIFDVGGLWDIASFPLPFLSP